MFRAGLLLIIRRIDSVYKAIGIVMRCVDWLLAAASQHLHQIITPCSLKFHILLTFVLKIFVFRVICSSFQLFPQHPVVLPAFFSVDIFTVDIFSFDIFSVDTVLEGLMRVNKKPSSEQPFFAQLYYLGTKIWCSNITYLTETLGLVIDINKLFARLELIYRCLSETD